MVGQSRSSMAVRSAVWQSRFGRSGTSKIGAAVKARLSEASCGGDRCGMAV